MDLANVHVVMKYKAAGWQDTRIAKKMGISEKDVQHYFQIGIEQLNQKLPSGYASLCEVFSILLHQYQLMGESFKQIAKALGNVMPLEEVMKILNEGDEHSDRERAAHLLNRAIVLRPFQREEIPEPSDPEKN